MSDATTVDIVLPVHDGEEYLPEQLRSLREQTHGEWRLWIRDDGSTDGSFALLEEWSAADPRIRLHPRDGNRLGATASFGWLLERLPPESRYVLCCDQDDRWLPDKIDRSLAAARRAESEPPGAAGPVLVHTDLVVADPDLRVIHPSLWAYQKIRPQPATLRRLMAQDTVTGCTVLVNRALLDRALPVPEGAAHHDRWLALVASLLGRIVSLARPTVLYRQHGENVVGARDRRGESPRSLLRKGFSFSRTREYREALETGAREAALLLERFGDEMSEEEARRLSAHARLPSLGVFGRKLGALRLRTLPERGLLRNLAAVLRA